MVKSRHITIDTYIPTRSNVHSEGQQGRTAFKFQADFSAEVRDGEVLTYLEVPASDYLTAFRNTRFSASVKYDYILFGTDRTDLSGRCRCRYRHK